MKKIIIFALAGFCAPALGQTPSPAPDAGPAAKIPKVESTWPGVIFQIPEVDRIGDNRLLVVVEVTATPQAPGSTLIGTPPPPLPPDASLIDKARPQVPQAFSLGGATMTEEKTLQKFEMQAPNPHGPTYRPSVILGWLCPGETLYMTIQFQAPPPPLPDTSGHVPKQTISVLLPNAKGPITGIVVPPPDAKPPSP